CHGVTRKRSLQKVYSAARDLGEFRSQCERSAFLLATVAIFLTIVRKLRILMKILAESTLTSKEQLTVPKVVRQLLDLHAGDSLVWSLDKQGQLVVSGGRPHSLADIRAAVA